MIVLLSHPEQIPDETRLVTTLLETFPELIFHLRKPEWNEQQISSFLQSLKTTLHPQIILHHHYQLTASFQLKGIHLPENARRSGINHPEIISTSFHRLEDARNESEQYTYFFCSPVFPSISKSGYHTDENWSINSENDLFKTKAVALGGIEPNRLTEVRKRGFNHIAVLGAVWKSADPIRAMNELVQAF
jgi:thiamine-phosphate pyrophosphorylase